MNQELLNIGLIMSDHDNVATLPWGGRAGEPLALRGGERISNEQLVLHDNVSPGHKVAITPIREGSMVLKYGLSIGRAKTSISAGCIVHVENVRSRFDTAPESEPGKQARHLIASGDLRDFIVRLLVSAGVGSDIAGDFADHCVSAEERGVSTHGIRRIQALVERLREGGIDGSASPHIDRYRAVLLVDGRNGLGHHIGRVSADALVETAGEFGVGVALVRNSSHFGYAGFYASRLAERGLVGMAISNGQVLVGPPGARRPIFSNNPFALSAPVGEDGLFEFDMATSVTSRAKIAIAAEIGARIEAGTALDAEGCPTTDAASALAGILLPLGGQKGFGFIAALEVLTGILPGGAYANLVASKEKMADTPEGTSHFLMAIAPSAWGGETKFRAAMADLEKRVASLPMANGHARARFPGTRRAAIAGERQDRGIPVDATTLRMLHELATRAGVQPIKHSDNIV